MTSEEFDEHYFTSADGLRLYGRDYRPTAPDIVRQPPVVCLAGLSRNSRDFHRFAAMLRADPVAPRRVVTLDYRGRGQSDWDENKANYNIGVESADTQAAMAGLGIERAVFVGTSRGGLILHLMAENMPHLIQAVVLNDIGPVLEPEGLQEIAAYLGRQRRPEDWDDAARILAETHGATFPALDAADWRELAAAIYAERYGRIVADFDPAIAAPLQALDPTQPLPDLWQQFEALRAVPLMAIRGAHSRLLSEATLDEMARRHPRLRRHVARGQGHAPLLHKPDVFSAITAFLLDI